MLFWKIFAVVDVFLALAYSYAVWTGKERLEPSDTFWTPIWLAATVGVICYAFSLNWLHPLFWHYFLPAYAGAAAWEIASIVKDAQAEMSSYIGVALVMILAGLTMVPLHRLGGSGWIQMLGA